jgi:hypothetical protein
MPRAESKGDDDSYQEEKGCNGDPKAVPRVSLLSLDVSPNHCGVSEVPSTTLHLTSCSNENTAREQSKTVLVDRILVRCSC